MLKNRDKVESYNLALYPVQVRSKRSIGYIVSYLKRNLYQLLLNFNFAINIKGHRKIACWVPKTNLQYFLATR